MRLKLEYEINPSVIPRNYRIGFLSLIKKLIEQGNSNLFKHYYSKQKLKPFTFSIYFPQLKGNYNDSIDVGNKAIINFSTSSLELASIIYNGFINTDEHQWNYNEDKISFKPIRAFIFPLKKITKDEIEVKTLSPILVNNKGSSNKFLYPNEEGFKEGLEFSVKESAKEFLNYQNDFQFEFAVKAWKPKVIYHYEKTPCVTGLFVIKSEPEILQMIYDIGIGVHRSQGFGMLEVIK